MSDAPFVPANTPTRNRPRNLGTSVNDDAGRLDGVEKVDGTAKYGRDVFPARCAFARFVRCPYGAATLESADEAAARAVPGVLRVELDGEEARYHGQPVGVVAAESPAALDRAMQALACRWRIGDPVTSLEQAAEDDLEPEAPAAVRERLAGAAGTVEAVYATPVQTHSSLETHGAVVDHRGDEAVAWISTQGVQGARDGLERATGLPSARLDVRAEYVGGGFGSKLFGAGKEGSTAARLSRELRRPVHLFCDRAEEHLDTGNRPSSRTLVRMGVDAAGKVLGGQIRTWGGTGVGRGGGGVSVPSGYYDLGEVDRSHQDVSFNAGGPRPFRAPGKPQGAFAEELMLEELAASIDMDPLALRLVNDRSAARRAMLEAGAERFGWADRSATGAQTGTLRRGFGIAVTGWGTRVSGARAEVVVHRDGSVLVRTGTQDIGTGTRTAAGALAAAILGVPLETVRVEIGRSSLPPGPSSGGSVTLSTVGPAIEAAAEDARDQLLDSVAEAMQVARDQLALDGDGHVVRRGTRTMDFAAACRTLADRVTGGGQYGRRNQRERFGDGHSDGVQFVDLHLDVETGVVRVDRVLAIQSCGKVVCRKTAESQVIGGVIQGLSYALHEERVLDRRTGSMLNANLEWYRILGPRDMPHVEPWLWREGQSGIRALGEPPIIPTAAAVACAVYNAVGRPVRSLPLTPERVLSALDEGGAA